MKIFLDTADIDAIKRYANLGIVDGVTTNPTLIAQSGKDFFSVIQQISEIILGPISAEVIATDAPGMIHEGKKLAKISKHVTVKVPLTFEGLKACHSLSSDGIMVNVTLCFSAAQALLAAKAGATFVSPFVGRLDDIGADGMALIADICSIFSNYSDLKTEVLVASIRNPLHVQQAAILGAHVVTLPPKVLDMMFDHPLTTQGLDKFLYDWDKSGQKI